MLNILCLLALVVHGHAYLSCLDDSGAQVDHWTGIKGNDNNTMYYYNEATKLFKLSPFMVDQTARGAIMTTLQPLYDSPANETMAYIMWNDAPPGDYTPSSIYAHSKGILATDGVQGFMMTHSMPNWPEAPDCGRAPSDNPGCNGINPGIFPSDRYAQSMACVTVSAATVNQMANTIRINYPWVYGLNMPEALKVQQQYMDDLINKRKISKTNETASNALFSLSGVRYTLFAKSESWGEDLWDDLVAPYYGSPMYVETWINGSGGPMSSTCENSTFPNKKVNETFDIYQVSGIDMPDGNDWANTQDHSKWGVAKSTEIGNPEVFDTSQVCIGDINRMCTQEKRGGGALCTQDSGLLNAFMDIITGVEACYSKDPCASSTGFKCYWCPLPVPSPAPTTPEPTELPAPTLLPTAVIPTVPPTLPTGNTTASSTAEPAFRSAVKTVFVSFFTVAYFGFAVLTAFLFFKVMRSDSNQQRGYLIVLTLIPTLSSFSSVSSVLTTTYASSVLHALSALFLAACELPLLVRLYKLGAQPRFTYEYPGYRCFSASLIWIGSTYSEKHRCRIPTFEGAPLTGLPASTPFILQWVYAMLGQTLSLLTYFMWMCTQVHIPILLILGCFLYQNQGISAAAIWNQWFRLFTGSRNYDSSARIDIGILNEVRCYLCIAQSLVMIVIHSINISLVSLWDRNGIVLFVGSSLLVLDVALKYARYYLWHGYRFHEIPVEVSIFGFFKVDLGQEFVEPPEVHWDFSLSSLCDSLFYCCKSESQRALMREAAVQRTQDYYNDRLAVLRKAREAEIERTNRRNGAFTIRQDPAILEKKSDELGQEQAALHTLQAKYAAQQKQLQEQIAQVVTAQERKELEQEKAAVMALKAQFEDQWKQLRQQADELAVQKEEIARMKATSESNTKKIQVTLTVEVLMQQEAEQRRGIHTSLWENAWSDIDNALSPLAAHFIHTLKISCAKDLAALSNWQIKLLQEHFGESTESTEQSIVADLQQLHDNPTKDTGIRMFQCKCKTLWKNIVCSLPKFEQVLVEHKPPTTCAFELIKNIRNRFFANSLLQSLPTIPKGTLASALARMRVWNMQWSLFNQHLFVIESPFSVASKEQIVKVAPEFAVEIEMSILSKTNSTGNYSEIVENEVVERSTLKNPILTAAENEHSVKLTPNKRNTRGGMWFSTDDKYEMSFSAFDEL